MSKEGGVNIMQSYYLYSAILALKLLALGPLGQLLCNPEKIQKANVSDLKNLTPFWLVAALYIMTSPDQQTAIFLLRAFVAARFISAFGYVYRVPKMIQELSFFVSFAVTAFMAAAVIIKYKNAF